MSTNLTLSVVSHGHGALIAELLDDIARFVPTPLRLVLTLNRPDPEQAWENLHYPFEIETIRNASPKGFGANHNAALGRTRSDFFCVLNPDIRLTSDPFPTLASQLSDHGTGVVAPMVVAPDLSHEDHARDFPSIFSLAAKALGSRPATPPPNDKSIYHPDWIAGMFMMFNSETLRSVGGFDDRYFLYYEDVDLCARLRERGLQVAVCPAASVIHAARRESRRNLQFAFWHLRSALRYLATHPRMALGMHQSHR